MIGFSGENQEFERRKTLTQKQLEEHSKHLVDKQSHYLVSAAVGLMNEGVRLYWTKHYNLASGKTRQLALFSSGASEGDFAIKRKGRSLTVAPVNPKFKDKLGRRMISFTQEKPQKSESRFSASLRIHSFPMNLYERDVRVKTRDGGGYIRKGTHILRQHLPASAPTQMDKSFGRFMHYIDTYFQKENQK